MGESEREQEPESPGTAGPALVGRGGGRGNSQPRRPRPLPCQELLGCCILCTPTRSTPPPGHRLYIQTLSGTHPETHKDTLACGPSPSPSDERTLHPRCTFAHHRGAHTHIPCLTHTHSWSHTFRGGRQHRGIHAGTACPNRSQELHAPHPGAPVLSGQHIVLPRPSHTAQSCYKLPVVRLQKGQGPGTPWGHLPKAQRAQGAWAGEGLPQALVGPLAALLGSEQHP